MKDFKMSMMTNSIAIEQKYLSLSSVTSTAYDSNITSCRMAVTR